MKKKFVVLDQVGKEYVLTPVLRVVRERIESEGVQGVSVTIQQLAEGCGGVQMWFDIPVVDRVSGSVNVNKEVILN